VRRAAKKRAPQVPTAAALAATLDVAYHFGKKFLVLIAVGAALVTGTGWMNSRFIVRPLTISADSLNRNIAAVARKIDDEGNARQRGDSLLSANIVEQIQSARSDGYTKGQIDQMKNESADDRAEIHRHIEAIEKKLRPLTTNPRR